MDGQLASDSPAVVSGPAVFPSWYGGFNSSSQASVPVSSVRIYRPDNGGATFFRVASGRRGLHQVWRGVHQQRWRGGHRLRLHRL
uniref:PE-PGRS family protein n=1 Tax=Macrostomum lignano TaxID=282301 RepID=A0A1I8F514_9PLAT